MVEISALKGTGVMLAAEEAVRAANGGRTVPMHTFSGPVEHAIAHIEEAAVHTTVSYTHLDVYKRQAQGNALFHRRRQRDRQIHHPQGYLRYLQALSLIHI